MVIRKTNITAASEKELQMRISELEKRGYELASVVSVERPEDRQYSYDSTKRGERKPRDVYVGFERHRAVMQKDFAEVKV